MKISLKSFALAAIALASLHSVKGGGLGVTFEGKTPSDMKIFQNPTTMMVSASCGLLGYATGALIDTYDINWEKIKNNKIFSSTAFVTLAGLAYSIWNKLPDFGYAKFYFSPKLPLGKESTVTITDKKSLVYPIGYFGLGYALYRHVNGYPYIIPNNNTNNTNNTEK